MLGNKRNQFCEKLEDFEVKHAWSSNIKLVIMEIKEKIVEID
jgi:hypothetical protein